MNKEKLIIIGGVAAGASAAAKARRTNEFMDITIYEKTSNVSYANCGLPFYIGGLINNRNRLLLHTPKSLGKRFNLNIFTNHEVIEINPKNKTLLVKHGDKTFEDNFDKLIIATGANAIIPKIKGIERTPFFQMRTVEDVDNIKNYIERNNPKTAIIIGGGYIGVEIAEAMYHTGIKTTIIEAKNHILPNYSPEIALSIEDKIKASGIDILTNRLVTEVKFDNGKYIVILNDNTVLYADILFLATGVKPNVELAVKAGITLGETGAIKVNEYMQTNYDFIYAAGDAVEKFHIVSKKHLFLPLAGPANREGRIAGCNAAGGMLQNPGVIGTSVVGFLDKVVAKTGLSYEDALAAGFDADFVYTEDPDHAEYYPGYEQIFMKLIYDKKSKKILGVEASGNYNTARKVDAIASAIYGDLTIYDLENIDYCYAPPYGSAKDNINKAGFVAANQDRGEGFGIKPQDFLKIYNENSIQVIDVRTKLEYKAYKLEKAKNIYVNDIRDHLDEIDKNKPVYIHCAVGFRGYLATRFLRNLGYEAYNIIGGLEAINRIKCI
ncbi:FAD-dependent oxidoreductase [Deferribacter thermophilus]|uniref:FAD-dependent oxidoreductase n=1 Tax=Deferribacter thermophilus TaxID=53573 RepID=UPI003C1FF3C4